jgi:hypothetical protein
MRSQTYKNSSSRIMGSLSTLTTCDLYHIAAPNRLSSSVQSALFYLLHLDKNISQRKPLPTNIIKKIFKAPTQIFYQKGYSTKYSRNSDLDILFNYFCSSAHGLGVQRKLAQHCSRIGIKSGLVTSKPLNHFSEFEENLYISEKMVTRSSFVSKNILRQIMDECSAVDYLLNQNQQSDHGTNNISLKLTNIAIRIEERASVFQYFLEKIRPKLVVLVHGKMPEDMAMQIACKRNKIKTILIPHGFLQRSYFPLNHSLILSYCPHHDSYLENLSLPSSQIKGLGWLEPSVTLNCYSELTTRNHENSSSHSSNKYQVLFLSSMSGWEIHRCPSLVKRVPEVLKTLDEMPEVETIRVRLRPDESKNLLIQTLLTASGASKLEISTNPLIEEDLARCNTLISFNSTGALYGPYTNIKAIEIRDPQLNSVWSNSVLPKEQVYQIQEKFDKHEFQEFFRNSPTLTGNQVFYNWKQELTTFNQFLCEFI